MTLSLEVASSAKFDLSNCLSFFDIFVKGFCWVFECLFFVAYLTVARPKREPS